MTWPQVVAESLRRVRRPVDVAVPGASLVSAEQVAAVIRHRCRPDRSAGAVPSMLHLHQHDAWRRVMAALDRWHGALLAEAVGQGKTWIALGAAAATPGETVAVVPAILRDQWIRAAAAARVPVAVFSHELASRGRVPSGDPSLVIVDEAHRFRELSTRRTQTVAPWLVGRKCLLLTATPIVNRLDDLVNLLRLVLPDDALALDGIAALADISSRDSARALRRVVIRSAPVPGDSRRASVTIAPDGNEESRGARAVAAVSGLRLSEAQPVRQLVQSVLLDAAASSDAALHAALRRYRALLLQSRDAGGASRAMLRHFAGDALDQLVLWPLLDLEPAASPLPLADLDTLDQLLTLPQDDASWLDALLQHCAGPMPSVLFTRHRATATLLRTELGDGTAWVSGEGAGIGPHRMAREQVLDAFGPRRGQWRVRQHTPTVLVATDVAAEGLDLFAAGRIVHVDLPWTATRLDQREGRLLRLGQQHQRVEVVIRRPSRALETALKPEMRIRRKRGIAEEWLGRLERDDGGLEPAVAPPVVAWASPGRMPAELVAIELTRDNRRGVVVLGRDEDGEWTLDAAAGLPESYRQSNRIVDSTIAPTANSDGPGISSAVALAVAGVSANTSPPPADLMIRIHRLARTAAAQRDHRALQLLDRLLRFLAQSPTLGARIRQQQLRVLSDRDLLLACIPDLPSPDPLHAELFAAILYRSPG